MVIRDNSDLITAVALAGFGGFVIAEALGLPYVSEFGPGPGFFPLWIGIGIIALALVLAVGSFSTRDDDGETGKTRGVEVARALGAWAAFVVAIVLLSTLGFGISFGLLTAFLIRTLDRRSISLAFGVAIALALGFHLVFAVALNVGLPVGPLGF